MAKKSEMKFSRVNRRRNIRYRIRKKVKGTASKPRLSVFRSNKEIYCQLIDDVNGLTIVSSSSREAGISKDKNKSEQSKEVGLKLAERAKQKNIATAVFDRSGYLYHGRVKALADGAREAD